MSELLVYFGLLFAGCSDEFEVSREVKPVSPDSPKMRRHLFTVCLCLLAVAYAIDEAEAESFPDDDSAPYEDEVREDGFLEDLSRTPQIQQLLGRLQRSIDGETLLRARRWGNIANGALLAATGPIALVVSVFGLKLSNIVLSLYVTAGVSVRHSPLNRRSTHRNALSRRRKTSVIRSCSLLLFLSLSAQFGGMLAAVELGMQPIAPWVRSNLHYVATPPGRTALLAFLGGLTWPLGKMGLVPALLTCFNAVFNANFNPLLAYLSADDAQTAASRRAAAATRNAQVAAAAAEAEAAAAEAASAAGAQAGAQAALNAAQAAEPRARRRMCPPARWSSRRRIWRR